jgi:tetratricopeptide (TPR) repeat protein
MTDPLDGEREQERVADAILRETVCVCRNGHAIRELDARQLFLRSLIATRKGERWTALACAMGALQRHPSDVDLTMNVGRLLLREGQVSGALAAQLRAVVLAPRNAVPYRELGRVLHRVGRLSEATLAYQEAIRLDRSDAETIGELGDVLRACGRADEAFVACDHAFRAAPDSLASALRLGRVHLARRQWQLARETFERGLAVAEQPAPLTPADSSWLGTGGADGWLSPRDDCQLDFPDTFQPDSSRNGPNPIDPRHVHLYIGLGDALKALGFVGGARHAYRQALDLRPESLEASRRLVLALETDDRNEDTFGAWISLGDALAARHRFDEAVVAYRQAIRINPRCLRALLQCGRAHAKRGDLGAAVDCFERALATSPRSRSHTDLGRALAARGELAKARSEFVWFHQPLSFQGRAFTKPLWDGIRRLDGETILVWAGDALGDTIQWLRYVPTLGQLGARIIVECNAELVPLVKRMTGISLVVAQGSPLPPFDLHAPLTLLPNISPECRTHARNAPH